MSKQLSMMNKLLLGSGNNASINGNWRQQHQSNQRMHGGGNQCMKYSSHAGKKCHQCGEKGHLAAACKHKQQNNSTQRTTATVVGKSQAQECQCCGRAGHAKKDCRSKDAVCRNCQKPGHLARVCRSAPAAAADKQPSSRAGAKTYAEAVREETWKCQDLGCNRWNGEKAMKCAACGKPRLKE